MRVILVDDEKSMLLLMTKMLSKIEGIDVVGCFQSPSKAYKYMMQNKVDMAFIDINMPEESGLDFVKRVTAQIKDIAILFLTAHKEYALEAYGMYAFDYLVKPITQDKLETSIQKAKEKLTFLQHFNNENGTKRLIFNCLGCMEVKNSEGKNILFTSSKSSELLAYLIINKGRFVSKWRVMEDIFPDMPVQNAETYLNTTVYKLRKSLEPYNMKQSIISQEESYKIILNDIYVDLIDFENRIITFSNFTPDNQEEALNTEKLFLGELFGEKDYSWSLGEKEKVHEVYFSFTKKLITYLIETNQTTVALHITKKIISFNETDKDLNCLLMNIYALQKDKILLERQFLRYTNILKEDLGLYPENTVITLYTKLIQTLYE